MMSTTWDEIQWYRADKALLKQGLTFVVSLIIVLLVLMIPINLRHQGLDSSANMIIELSKESAQIESPLETVPPEPEIKPELKPIEPIKPLDDPPVIEKVEPVKTETPSKPTEQTITNEPVIDAQPILPSSAVILKSLYDGKPKLNTLPKDFQVRVDDPNKANEFIYQKVQQPKWNHVTKLIDEDVDKPRIEMGFYPLGFDGAVEKFMDKITYKKTFTTKYGTKIGCAITVIIAGCGWK